MHPRGCKGGPSDLGDLRGFSLPLALPVHQEGMHERQQSQQHQDQVHLEGEGAVRPSPPRAGARIPPGFSSASHSDLTAPSVMDSG